MVLIFCVIFYVCLSLFLTYLSPSFIKADWINKVMPSQSKYIRKRKKVMQDIRDDSYNNKKLAFCSPLYVSVLLSVVRGCHSNWCWFRTGQPIALTWCLSTVKTPCYNYRAHWWDGKPPSCYTMSIHSPPPNRCTCWIHYCKRLQVQVRSYFEKYFKLTN